MQRTSAVGDVGITGAGDRARVLRQDAIANSWIGLGALRRRRAPPPPSYPGRRPRACAFFHGRAWAWSSPADADIICARRLWTVAMISSVSMPWR
jgi:hypothetical protein